MDIPLDTLHQATDRQIPAVNRTVGSRVVGGDDARIVTLTQTYASPRAEVWNAITTGDRISRWLMPISGDLTVGGRDHSSARCAVYGVVVDPAPG